jgi:hypothetical protein
MTAGDFAERERFELSVEFYTLRRFSKPLVSATHPPLLRIFRELVALVVALDLENSERRTVSPPSELIQRSTPPHNMWEDSDAYVRR